MTHKARTKALSWLLSLALALGLLPGLTLPVRAETDVSYREASWDSTAKEVKYTEKTTSATELTSSTTAWSAGSYVVPAGGVTIGSRVTVSGTVNLILTDDATLTASKGITVLKNNTLNIYGQSAGTGKLIANGPVRYTGSNSASASCAGIGGYYLTSSGAINIHGGTVTATGGGGYETNNGSESSAGGAGIGGGGGRNGTITTNVETGSVTIYGGKVTATGGAYNKGTGDTPDNCGAGIGSGGYSSGNTVTIYGGTVIARSPDTSGRAGSKSAGIGGGIRAAAASVNIHGGTVTATGGYEGAGIGGGFESAGGTVNIHGGTVTATGGWGGAGIGGGIHAAGGTVNIHGGEVTATGGAFAAGIGGGHGESAKGGAGGTVTINGGEVTATGSEWGGMGIGGGGNKNNSNPGDNGTLTVGSIVAVTTSTNNSTWSDYNSETDTRARYMKAEPRVALPTINDAAQALSWTYGDTVDAASRTLSVAANVSDGGTLSYQWYRNTTDSASGGAAIEGETGTSYTVPDGTGTNAGTYYYYCVVTNTLEGGAKKAAGSVSSLTVAQKAVTLVWGEHEFTYNGTAQAPAATVTGLLGTDTCTVTVSGAQTDSNAKTTITVFNE